MKFKVFCTLFLLMIFPFDHNVDEAQAGFFKGAELQLGSGYRRGELDWNIAGDTSGKNPNVLSELEWENLDIFQTAAEGRVWFGSTRQPGLSLYIKGAATYGWILDGDNRDSDYAGDDRTLEFSRSENSGKDGNILDLSIGIGPQWSFYQQQFTIALLAGWSYLEQNLEISDGYQTVALDPSFLGPIPGLDSRYDTEWWGPWLGTDLTWRLTEQVTLCGSFAWHFAEYEAEANWNLRTDLAHPVSFRHRADGRGLTLDVAMQYQLTAAWLLDLSYGYQDWKADDGDSWTYGAGGGSSKTRLNEVNWRSHAVTLDLGYRF